MKLSGIYTADGVRLVDHVGSLYRLRLEERSHGDTRAMVNATVERVREQYITLRPPAASTVSDDDRVLVGSDWVSPKACLYASESRALLAMAEKLFEIAAQLAKKTGGVS